jgi:chaperonin GroEL
MLALISPMMKIIDNAGGWSGEMKDYRKNGIGVNVVNMTICNMMEAGIIDPTKVTKEAVRNAVSVATTLLSTDTVITNIRA